MTSLPFPQLQELPNMFPLDNAVRIELQEGVPVFRASAMVQARIEELLDFRQERALSTEEQQELERYAEIDDYLSWINRIVRNQLMSRSKVDS